MSLESGQNLSHYEILAPLGSGGMGEVYRARDTKLGREVAIKVLPAELAQDEDRLRRFEREARTLALLNHPHVAGIYGVDQEGDVCFLALELVSGEDLSTRLSRGPLPIAEAMDVCRQIAEGLEAAHEAGVVHRDLKPANVRITTDGVAKILDFGLAKPMDPKISGDAASTAESDSFLMTEAGQVLGTPTYMAPEQARGRRIDRRVDVWAFGCVLFECLTAGRAFVGETIPDVLAAVLQEEPDWTRLPTSTPAHVRALLARCLEKDPRQRLRDIGDAWLELTRTRDVETSLPSASASVASGRWLAVAGLAVALAGGALLGYAVRGIPPEPERSRVARVALPQAPDRVWRGNEFASTFAISRDGESVVYCSEVERGPFGKADALVLWRRSEPESEILWRAAAGRQMSSPVFSPDGDWVAFQVKRAGSYELRRVSTLGGEPETLCRLPNLAVGASWGPKGTILFGTLAGGIYSVSEQGGMPEPVTTPELGVEWLHRSPVFLPGGEEMLFVIDYEGVQFEVALRSLTSGHQETLLPGATSARYLAPGFVVYTKGQNLWVDRFDLKTHQLGGRPIQLPDRIASGLVSGSLDLGQDGTLIYAAPKGVAMERALVWVNREGREEATAFPPSNYSHVAISPSGTRAVFGFGVIGGELRVGDLDRESLEHPLVSERAQHPVWTSNGEQLVWYDLTGGHLARQSATGAGLAERGGLFETYPLDLLEGQQVLHFRVVQAEMGMDLFLTPFDGNPESDAVPLLAEVGDQVYGTFSRDGKWLAYVTVREGGGPEVFVSPVPVEGPGTQVTSGGGRYPRWNREGDELFFATPAGNLMRVAVTAKAPDLEFGEPVLLYDGLSTTTGWPNRPFDVTPDGQRCLVIKDDPYAPAERPELRLVVNWIEELKERFEDRD